MEFEQAASSYICRYCKGSFDHLENLQKHVQQIHTARSFSKEKNCPLCGLRCVKYETYRDHLKHIHRQTEEGKAFVLKCFNDFLVWKNELEKRNYCKYIMQGAPKVIQPSKEKIHVYHCDSSTPTSKERKSACAAKDTCPSVVSAIESAKNHTVKVEYWNTHIGHIVPVQGEELDAAIGSLQTAEIVVDEQSYQSVDHDSENAIYFLTESNDGSFSESYSKETQKKQPPTLFQNNGNSSPNHTPKTMPRKFSFKKDPSKKSVSFSGSLASVACMKASVKKDPAPPVTSSAIEASDSQSILTTSVAPSAIETSDLQSNSEMSDFKSSKGNKTYSKSKITPRSKRAKTTEGNDSVPSPNPRNECATILPVTSSSQIKVNSSPLSQSVLSNLKLMVNDGKLNGQFILLNSLESQNGQQSLILCPVNGNISSGGQPITLTAPTKKQGAKPGEEKQLQQSGKGPVASSVAQNVLAFAENALCPAGVKRINLPPGPSILKKPGRPPKSTEVKISPPAGTPKARKRATRKKLLSVEETLLLAGATSSGSDVTNQVGANIVPSTLSQSIKSVVTVNSPMTANSSKPFPVSGSKVLPNSLTPGVSYIQFNNTLFPINSIAGPNLNSNYMFTSPMPSASNAHPSKLPLSFSALAQPATTLVMSTTNSTVIGTAPINSQSKLPNNNLPVIVISQLGNNPPTMPITSLSSVSARKSFAKSSSPMTKSMQTITNSILPNIGKIRSSLIQTNAQFIPSPRLLAVPRPRMRHAVPPPSLGLRGLRPGTPMGNAVQVNTVQLPSSNAANLPIPTKTTVNLNSKSTAVNSVVSNTEPISSTPAITIPSTPIAHPQKPGAFIFESSGDLYVLEPIEDTLKSDLSVKKSSVEAKSDTESSVIGNDAVENVSDTDSATSPVKPKICALSPKKVESKSKKPKICPTFSDGKKIAALPQKRRMKEDDSEILKKVKYYNLEMKYLSSQAECKRLKLELAKVNMRNKESTSSEVVPMTLDDNFSENTEIEQNLKIELSNDPIEDNDELVIDQLTDSLLKQIEKIQNDKLLNKDLQNELKDDSKNQLKENVEPLLEEKISQKEVETENDEQPMDYEVVNSEISNDIIKDQLEDEGINAGMGENVVSCQESEDKDASKQEIESKAISPQEIEEKSVNSIEVVDKSPDNNELLYPSADNYEIMDRTMENSITEIEPTVDVDKTSINNSETVDGTADNSETVNELLYASADNYELMDRTMENSITENEPMVDVDETSINNSETVDGTADNSETVNESLYASDDNYELMDSTMENSITENEPTVDVDETSINNSETVDVTADNSETVNEYIDFSDNLPEFSSCNVNDEQESCSKLGDHIQTVEEEPANLQALNKDPVMEMNDFENDQYTNAIEDVQYFDSTKSSEEQAVLADPCEDHAAEETLKELEIQYGENSSDIYTMIRTSVLRSLYADMKELCQENKKLFEELQSFKSHGESYEVVVEETQIGHL